jgi:MFS transporter, UMF1 family
MQTAPKKVINGWAFYDWANSVYSLVITTTFFPVYYEAITSTKADNKVISDKVYLFGREFVNTALSTYILALAFLIVALASPILSSIADSRGNKKRFMQVLCLIGSIACSLLFFFKKETINGVAQVNIGWGLACSFIAAIGYWSSLVFYNSYLPEIAAPEDRDRISAKGFAMGYIGSVLLQIIGFALVMYFDSVQQPAMGPRYTFLLVGLWWFGFAQITFRVLPKSTPSLAEKERKNFLTDGYKELRKVWRQLMQSPVMKRFLGAFFFFSIGVQTVMLVATYYGSKVLNLEAGTLIITVVIIQIVAVLGAWAMSRLSGKYGNLRVLMLVVVLWIFICIAAYYMQTATHFFILAALVGLVMGGIQSLSRSTYAKLMPETKDTASFFSFYDVTEKVAIVIGMFSFGYLEELTGDMRNSVLALIVFFVLGLIMLLFALSRQKKEAVQG